MNESLLFVMVPHALTRDLSPNGRLDRWAKARAARAMRDAAYWATRAAVWQGDMGSIPDELDLWVTVWLGYRARMMDDDNARACCKSLLDGIAQGVGKRSDAGCRIVALHQRRAPGGVGCVDVELRAREA